MRLTDNFVYREFVESGDDYLADKYHSNIVMMANEMEVIRRLFGGRSVFISSGFRSRDDNKRVGGSSKSYHLIGLAVDFKIRGYSVVFVYLWLYILMLLGLVKRGGLGLYKSHVHYDVRGSIVVWYK